MIQDNSVIKPIGHIRLAFDQNKASKAASSLSAVEQFGSTLWLVGDETLSIERLSTRDYANYGNHVSFPLEGLFPTPGGPDQEFDLEGLAIDDEGKHLWLLGSHSWRRKQPPLASSGADALKRLRKTDRQANRYLLGRVRLKESEVGLWSPEPGTARCLALTEQDGGVASLLTQDELLAPFLQIPSKDNGFDLEGLAVKGDTVYLGLRGPVLRGWASILQLHLEKDGDNSLKPTRYTKTRRPYLHHVLDLGGLGIRDLCRLGQDLLILAGPSMALDGPITVFRLRDILGAEEDLCIDDRRLEQCFEIPTSFRGDHAEGLAMFTHGETGPTLLVVYDSPAVNRLHEGKYVEADLFPIAPN